ncbi:pseudouridine synthase [Sphingomonas oligoaromativorans]|uniref:pseudouridine synthase n=1 Tax=Sphingomonas oligoaromativorans TaxID=575322 RepID=UPI001422B199|nr:23S rRNA pseudouridine2605 synthase [Sphingomonas oligoaromativorans]
MSAPRRPGDDRRAGRRAEPRDRRGSPPRTPRTGDEAPRDDKPSEGKKPQRASQRTGAKPRTNRSEAWVAARPPRERDAAARPTTGRKPRERRAAQEEPHSPAHDAAPWDAAPTGQRPAAPRADGRRRGDAPAARPARREDGSGRPTRGRRPERGDASPHPPSDKGKPARGARAAPAHGADRGEKLLSRPPRGEGEGRRPARPAESRGKPARAVEPEKRERRPTAPRRASGKAAAAEAPAPRAHSRKEPQRIAKLLARAGVASRREIERMIAEGRIALDGKVLDTPATILTSLRGVTVDGQQVDAPEHTRLFLFHKPVGFLTTEHDPAGRPTIYDRLPEGLPRVMPIGRLDMNTEGLLLLTTDGEFKRKLELPSSGIPRVYRARAYGEITQEQLEALSEGITIEGIRYGSIDANMERRTGRNVWIEMKITEGKNREIRRVLEYLGLQVSRLIRVAYGEFVLADLPAGEVVEVRQNDLVEFRKTLR